MSNEFFAANLRKLADYLSGLPDNRYNHRCFQAPGDCGTAGCAVGHAAASGLFGSLRMVSFGGMNVPRSVEHPASTAEAADALFGPSAYSRLFALHAYDARGPSRQMVVARIRERADELAPAPRYDFEALAARLAREPNLGSAGPSPDRTLSALSVLTLGRDP